MKLVLIFASVAILTGCACDPVIKTEVVTKYEYVVRKASDQQKVLPSYPTNLNVETADQNSLAQWIADNEKRQLDLESTINRLVEFYEAEPTAAEKAAGK